MTKTESLYFLVTGGAVLDLCKAHIAARQETHKRNCAMAIELGASQFQEHILDGTICSVIFDGPKHPDFKNPDKHGACAPKKNTEWQRKFAENKGYDRSGSQKAEALGIPTHIDYTYEGGRGWSAIASPFSSDVGFLWLSNEGPFALYIPDVASAIAEHEAQGHVVSDAVKAFKPVFDGAHPIHKEEWVIMVAQHQLAEKMKAVGEPKLEAALS